MEFRHKDWQRKQSNLAKTNWKKQSNSDCRLFLFQERHLCYSRVCCIPTPRGSYATAWTGGTGSPGSQTRILLWTIIRIILGWCLKPDKILLAWTGWGEILTTTKTYHHWCILMIDDVLALEEKKEVECSKNTWVISIIMSFSVYLLIQI